VADNSIAKIIKITALLGLENLKIPNYQRPYKWSRKHVLQLVDDLIFHQDKNRYSIGTVVLHHEENEFNIVDGQQRTVTLSLILHVLGFEEGNPLMIKSLNEHLLGCSISRKNIQNNYATIKQRLESVDKEKLKAFILNHCEVVKVILKDLSEAFQFFDSQNARGKSLEPYDLLKAFHLREMAASTEGEKKACVEKWEEAIKEDELKPLFNEYLYRIREWVCGNQAFYFTKENVGVFKGVSFQGNSENDYPYAHAMRITDYFIIESQSNPFITLKTYPFQIDQVMINGKRFFEYVEHYRKCLCEIEKTKHDCFKIIDEYDGRHRTGDKYTRNLFQAALLYYVDKFGKHELDKAVHVAFFWAYSIRLENTAVRLATMDNKAREDKSMFRVIAHAVHPKEVLSFPYHKANKETAIDGEKPKATNVEKIMKKYDVDVESGE